MKTPLFIILLVCVGLGYYAWRQQQNSVAELKQLQAGGVDVTFHLVSRPLLAVDTDSQLMYLLSGHGVHEAQIIPLSTISEIKFIESPILNPKDNSEPQGPDYLEITTKNGQRIRVGDLKHSAQLARQYFEQHHLLTDRLITKHRKD